MPNKKIFIIAGEVSGDIIGAKIINRLKKDFNFIGIGGENMKKSGLKPIFSISKLSIMGFFEVISKLKTIINCINITADTILKEKPEIVLSIDSPSFIKKVIKKVKKYNKEIKFFHIVAPQVWAWGEWRAKKYASMFDKLYTFFDFEKKYFEKYGLKCISTGHPSIEELIKYKHLPEKQILLLPGSRLSEVKKILPTFKEIIDNSKEFKFYISVVETTEDYIKNTIKLWENKPKIISKNRYKYYIKSYIAIATSGTVSVELAILNIPSIIIYKMNIFTEILAKILVKVKYASLINILKDKLIYPELLGNSKVNFQNINKEINKLLIKENYNNIKLELIKSKKIWKKNKLPTEIISNDIKNSLKD